MNPPKKKHYLFIRRLPDSLPWGGLELLMLDWFERINYAECEVTLLITPGGKALFSERFSSHALEINIIEYPLNVDASSWKTFTELYYLIRAIKPSTIIFIQGIFIDFRFSYVFAAFLSAPGHVYMSENLAPTSPTAKTSKKHLGFIPGLALWWHTPRFFYMMRAYLCRKIIAVSQEIKDQLISLWTYPKSKIEVAHHGIDIKTFKPSLEERKIMRESLKISDNEVLIFLAARLTQVKRIDRAIEAFDLVSKDFPDAKIVIAGKGPLENELRTLAKSKNSSSKILFLGHLNNIAPYMQMCDINLLTSDNEGFGIALVEALATGLICVSTRCPGPNEIIQDQINGFLVDKSVPGVSQGLSRALRLSTLERAMMSKRAIEVVRTNFEINSNIQKAFALMQIPFFINTQ